MSVGAIVYKRHRDELDDEFFHPDCPVLYRDHDTIGGVCPFPTRTDTFEVVHFGSIKDHGEKDRKHGVDGKFAAVLYEKSCGHRVLERITFWEKVETFNHYGTVFEGASYSINDWERRIERFRNGLPCDVCHNVDRIYWLWSIGEGARSRKKAMEYLLLILDYNYENWRDLIDIDEVAATLKTIKYGGDEWERPRKVITSGQSTNPPAGS